MTAGTIFDKTRTPLTTWLAAAWHVTNQKNGASALGLQRVLGLGSYETAWAILHRLRSAMVRPDRDRLSGDEEVDERYVGGEETGVARRQTQTIVAIAVERHRPRGFGHTPLRHMADCSADSLMPFVRDLVEAGSTVCTDGWKAYDGLPQAGYQRYRQVLSGSPDPAHGVHARGALRGQPAQALAAGHPPGVGGSSAPASLPQRVHLPLQPAQQPAAWPAVLPAAQASRDRPSAHRP